MAEIVAAGSVSMRLTMMMAGLVFVNDHLH